jgi:hypothetical protein
MIQDRMIIPAIAIRHRRTREPEGLSFAGPGWGDISLRQGKSDDHYRFV